MPVRVQVLLQHQPLMRNHSYPHAMPICLLCRKTENQAKLRKQKSKQVNPKTKKNEKIRQ